MKTKSRPLFRFLQNGEEIWQGRANDADHAEERAFWDETPGSLERFTLQRWGRVKLTKQISGMGWITVYSDACLAPSY